MRQPLKHQFQNELEKCPVVNLVKPDFSEVLNKFSDFSWHFYRFNLWRKPCVVFVRQRSTEQGHEAVTQKLVDRALVAVHLGQSQLEEAVEHGVHRLGSQPLSQSRRVGQIAEQYSDLLTLAFQSAARGEDLLGQVLRGVRYRRGGVGLHGIGWLDRLPACQAKTGTRRPLGATRTARQRETGTARPTKSRLWR